MRTLAAMLALCSVACGEGTRDGPGRARPPIVAPGRALRPIAPPAAESLDPMGREILQGREHKLAELVARGAGPGLGAAYGELGKAYQAFGFDEAAVDCYENARVLAPGEVAWDYLLAHVRMRLGQPDAAIAALERALARQPEDLPALLYLGEVQAAASRFDRARAAYERALQASPDNAPAAFALGRIALLQGDAPEAIRRLERALLGAPGADRIHYLLALAYRQAGDPSKSSFHLARRGESVPIAPDPLMEEVAEINPRNYAPRAFQALRAGNPSRAVALLRAASAALPEDAELRVQLGIALSSAGASREAIAEYQAALRLQPENPRALYYLGTTLAALGRHEEAAVSLRRALARSPENAPAQLALAKALQRMARLEEALEPVEEAVRLDPTSVEARLEEGRLLARLGRCADATQRVERSVDLFPGTPALTGLLARLLAACAVAGPAEGEQALRLARAAFASEGDAENAATVALVLAARGDWAEASAWQRRALGLLPAASPPGDREAFESQLRAIEARRVEAAW